MSDDNDDLNAVLAGEYVLGLMDAAASRAVEARAAADPALAREIAAWRERLEPLADLAPPAPPSDLLWRRIRKNLPRAGSRPRPNLWRLATFGSLAVAAGLAAFIWVGAPRIGGTPLAQAVAVLTVPGTAQPGLRAAITSPGTLTITPLRPLDAAPGYHFGFWAWPHDHAAPVLLGTLPPQGGQLRFPFPVQDATPVMVTTEPDAGGAGAPGPTVYLGMLATIVPGQ